MTEKTKGTSVLVLRGTKLTCVAVVYKGVIYVIPAPAEHNDVIDYIKHTLAESELDGTQECGFLTDKDEYLNFNDGIALVKRTGKLIETHHV